VIRAFGWDEIWFIILSVRWTVLLTLLALAVGGVLGFAVALGRVSLWAPLRTACLLYIQVIQGIPVLMLLLLSYYGLPLAGLELPPLLAASVSMGLYASGYLGEIWRGAIQAVPWQQWETRPRSRCGAGSSMPMSSCPRLSASPSRRPWGSWCSW